MFWKLVIIAAFIGMILALTEGLRDKIWDGIGKILSFFISGLFWGLLIGGGVLLGEFMCILNSDTIFGYNPFLVGFIIGILIELLQIINVWIKTR